MPRATTCGWPTVEITADQIGWEFTVKPCGTRPHHTITVETEGVGGKVWHLCCEHRHDMLREVEAAGGLSVRTDEEIPTEIFAHIIWDKASERWAYRAVINGLTMPAVQLKSGTYEGAKLEAGEAVKRLQAIAEQGES